MTNSFGQDNTEKSFKKLLTIFFAVFLVFNVITTFLALKDILGMEPELLNVPWVVILTTIFCGCDLIPFFYFFSGKSIREDNIGYWWFLFAAVLVIVTLNAGLTGWAFLVFFNSKLWAVVGGIVVYAIHVSLFGLFTLK